MDNRLIFLCTRGDRSTVRIVQFPSLTSWEAFGPLGDESVPGKAVWAKRVPYQN